MVAQSTRRFHKADRASIPERNKTGGIIGDPIIPPLPSSSSSSLSPSPPAPEEEEEMPIPEDLKLPRIYGNKRERERPVHREDVTRVFALLKTRPPSWYDYVLEHTKSVERKSGEPLTFTQTENVMSNLMLGATVYPEVMISSDIYSDGHDEIDIYFMALLLCIRAATSGRCMGGEMVHHDSV
jgi:hypothetical protein